MVVNYACVFGVGEGFERIKEEDSITKIEVAGSFYNSEEN